MSATMSNKFRRVIARATTVKKIGEGLNATREVEEWNGKVEQQPR